MSEDGAGGANDATTRGGLRRLGGPDKQQKFVPGELLVRFRSNVGPRGRSSLLGALGATTKRRLPLPGLQLVRIGRGQSVPQAVAALERRAEVRYAEPNFIYRVQATPNDPRYGELWGLNNTGQSVNGTAGTPDADIDAPEAWDTTTGSGAVTVAVVDTGVAYDHPDLAPNIHINPGESGAGKDTNGIDDDENGFVDDWRGWDFVSGDNDPRDLEGHGTHVAGTIGARGSDGQGVVGVNWQVGLMPVRVCDPGGLCTNADVASGFAYAGANGAKVVNASLGGYWFSLAQSEAIANSPGTLFVVAAGNSGIDVDFELPPVFPRTPFYPCSLELPNIVCVAATTQTDELADFSNYGVESVDLGAPGTNILSARPAYETILSEVFEGDIGSTWSTGGTNDSWARSSEAANSGSFSLTDSPGGDYLNNTNSYARTAKPFSLSGKSGCRLEYELRLATETDHDALLIDASSNGTSWATVGGWTGSSLGRFVNLHTDLSAFDGEGKVFIGFRLQSDASVTDDGAHIDDVKVQCLTSSYSGEEFRFLQGTSMATPHVAGAAALLWAKASEASRATVRPALLSSVDVLPALDGKTVSGGRVNVDRALDALDAPQPHTVVGGPEVQVNETTAGDQSESAIAPDGSGGFTVVWENSHEWLPDLYARRFNAAGAPLSGEILVNSPTVGNHRNPAIAPDGEGGFSVAWHATGVNASDVFARHFDAEGSPLTDEIPVNVTTAGNQWYADVVSGPGGGFAVVWWSAEQDGSGQGVYARRFDAAGAPLTGEIPVNVTTGGEQRDPAIASDPDGGFTVAWNGNGSSGSGVYARRFDAAGTPLTGEIAVGKGGDAAIAPGPDGGFTVAWCCIRARSFDAEGSPLAGEIPVNTTTVHTQKEPTIAAGPGGGFTIAWTSGEGGPEPYYTTFYDVYARRFNASGTPLGGEIPINATIADGQFNPAIASDGSGGFSVTWTGGAEIDYYDVYARHFVEPPDTAIDFGPVEGSTIDDPTPTFTFSSSEEGSSFECRLDGAPFSVCGSPHTTASLPDGPHIFEVRATDAAANTDPSVASRSFTVDTVPPDTQINSGPAGLTNDNTPTFGFSSNEAAGFECRLDGGTYSACSSPLTTAPLPDGPHSFEVRATDEVGHTDPSPASRAFTVDTVVSAPPASPRPDTTTTASALAAPPPALTALPLDTVPPKAKLFGKRKQEAGKPIEIVASCAEDCALIATGRVVVSGAPKSGAARAARRPTASFKLRKVARQLSAGHSATLRLRLKSKKAKRRLGRLVRSGRKARGKIRVNYSDRAGNASTARMTIRLRRG